MLTIIGSNGQLGWELVNRGRRKGIDILAIDFPDIDITDPESIRARIPSAKTGCVVNAAAYTAVDKAESESEAAFAVNRDGPGHLARHCGKIDLPLIHISTDYVFDGSKPGAYTEQDPVSPVGAYGVSKAEGERAVRKNMPMHVILRTAWLYGVHGHNFVKTILALGRESDVVRVVMDQEGCPTYAADLAEAILTIVDDITGGKSTPWGTYHFCNAGATTWYGFAEAIYDIAKKYEGLKIKELVPITTVEYPLSAKRPANSVLDCARIEQVFDIRPRRWETALSEMMADLYRKNNNDAEISG
jgi:dTDP-4-dehydrorhamnose reductase